MNRSDTPRNGILRHAFHARPDLHGLKPRPATPRSTSATVVIADPKPLSLLATAGVLHQQGIQCICARTEQAALKAFGITESDAETANHSQAPSEKRIDGGQDGVPTTSATTPADLLVWDVDDDAQQVLDAIKRIRQVRAFQDLPVVLIAEARWAGLERKTEAMAASTHCLFKPIDPKSLITIVEQLLWMPSLQSAHRDRGTRPNRPGWVTL